MKCGGNHAGCGDVAGIEIKYPCDTKYFIIYVLGSFCGDAGILFVKDIGERI